jgi:hypothetical protein
MEAGLDMGKYYSDSQQIRLSTHNTPEIKY